MKKILFIIFLLNHFVLMFGQIQNAEKSEPKVFTEKQIIEMAVFPGCGNKAATDKEGQKDCISKKLNEKLTLKLKHFGDRME